mmetsp:Transcript_5139/g.9722  ORF Transcript_5139/g.9722 Transcript_5139/m.9722 type:complete len:294 (-) Transcript_5139:368-1249(-)
MRSGLLACSDTLHRNKSPRQFTFFDHHHVGFHVLAVVSGLGTLFVVSGHAPRTDDLAARAVLGAIHHHLQALRGERCGRLLPNRHQLPVSHVHGGRVRVEVLKLLLSILVSELAVPQFAVALVNHVLARSLGVLQLLVAVQALLAQLNLHCEVPEHAVQVGHKLRVGDEEAELVAHVPDGVRHGICLVGVKERLASVPLKRLHLLRRGLGARVQLGLLLQHLLRLVPRHLLPLAAAVLLVALPFLGFAGQPSLSFSEGETLLGGSRLHTSTCVLFLLCLFFGIALSLCYCLAS